MSGEAALTLRGGEMRNTKVPFPYPGTVVGLRLRLLSQGSNQSLQESATCREALSRRWREPTVILRAPAWRALSGGLPLPQKRGIPYLLFEKESRPGGLVRSERVNGFSFDYTGHLLHMREERTRQLVLKDLGLEKAFSQPPR